VDASTLGTVASRAPNTASHIELHPSGRVLYASNRGDDSLAIFAVDGKGGIGLLGRIATGEKPRHFLRRLLLSRIAASHLTALAPSRSVSVLGLDATP